MSDPKTAGAYAGSGSVVSDSKTAGADAGSVVSDPQHSQKLLRVLQALRQDDCFQDAVLVLEGEQIPVQKNILAAASPYIRYENKLETRIHLHEMRSGQIRLDQ